MSEITLKQLESRPFVGIRRKVNVTQLVPFFKEVFPKVTDWLDDNEVEAASMPMAVWLNMDMNTGVADCHAGVFVKQAVKGEGEITPGETSSGDVLTAEHFGPYDTVGQTWTALFKKAAELGKAPGAGWEIYADDPETTPAARVRTQIFLPVL